MQRYDNLSTRVEHTDHPKFAAYIANELANHVAPEFLINPQQFENDKAFKLHGETDFILCERVSEQHYFYRPEPVYHVDRLDDIMNNNFEVRNGAQVLSFKSPSLKYVTNGINIGIYIGTTAHGTHRILWAKENGKFDKNGYNKMSKRFKKSK